jgi:hypothetical protein
MSENSNQENRKIIYSKKVKTKHTDYYYYIVKKGDEYYVETEAIDRDPVTPTITISRYGGKECLKISEEEVKEIIKLLKQRKYQEFEEKYGNKDWIINC